jgi:hypothetical protein
MAHGDPGYILAEIQQLARIRRLQVDLDLDLAAIEVVLNLRLQVSTMIARLEGVQQLLVHREQEYMSEVQQLRRRIAEAGDQGASS